MCSKESARFSCDQLQVVVCSKESARFSCSQLQIHYDKQMGNLIVHVLQARSLAQRDNNGYSDPFVKVYLLPGRG